jgi:hypothetical protein
MTVAEARAAGLLDKVAQARPVKVRSRRTARGAYFTRCMKCGTEFHTQASEDRHLAELPDHRRYEIIAGYAGGT